MKTLIRGRLKEDDTNYALYEIEPRIYHLRLTTDCGINLDTRIVDPPKQDFERFKRMLKRQGKMVPVMQEVDRMVELSCSE